MQALDLFGGREVALEEHKSYLRWLLKKVPTENISLLERNNEMPYGNLYLFVIGQADLPQERIKAFCEQFNVHPREILRQPRYSETYPNRKEDWEKYFRQNPMKIRVNGNRELELIADVDEAVGFLAEFELFGSRVPNQIPEASEFKHL